MDRVGKAPGTDLTERTFQFSIRIVRLCSYISNRHRELKVLANQLLKSGTSIGANVEEAQAGQSKADFLAKYHISLKEARETGYWLRLLMASESVPKERLLDILRECEEISKILGTSLVRGKQSNNRGAS